MLQHSPAFSNIRQYSPLSANVLSKRKRSILTFLLSPEKYFIAGSGQHKSQPNIKCQYNYELRNFLIKIHKPEFVHAHQTKASGSIRPNFCIWAALLCRSLLHIDNSAQPQSHINRERALTRMYSLSDSAT